MCISGFVRRRYRLLDWVSLLVTIIVFKVEAFAKVLGSIWVELQRSITDFYENRLILLQVIFQLRNSRYQITTLLFSMLGELWKCVIPFCFFIWSVVERLLRGRLSLLFNFMNNFHRVEFRISLCERHRGYEIIPVRRLATVLVSSQPRPHRHRLVVFLQEEILQLADGGRLRWLWHSIVIIVLYSDADRGGGDWDVLWVAACFDLPRRDNLAGAIICLLNKDLLSFRLF